MRAYLVVAGALALAGCGHAAMPQKTALGAKMAAPPSPGRVVVYRNGVAYVERFADVEHGTLSLAVPRDKVDDLLKSLTAVDVQTGEPVPVSYAPDQEGDAITLKIGGKDAKRRLRLTYVTSAPAWKPSYRVVVNPSGAVELQGWAVVDNASGEDWKDVRLGVGASSAMSFRYDLKGLRVVERDTLEAADQFAQARRPVMNAQMDGRSAASNLAKDDKSKATAPPMPAAPPSTDPIGTSHFESPTPMTVAKGESAMVSILRSPTEGEVVYLYDPQNPKADARFPYRTVRFRNPSDGALESGPVSVFGDGKFVGEGLAEPIPAKSIAFVPFAQDRQISVEQKLTTSERITRISGVSRGVFTTDVEYAQKHTYEFTNRLGERATVYLKYAVTPGFKLVKFPDTRSPAPGATDASDHLADASMFKVDLEPNGHVEIEIEEAVPQKRQTDIRAAGALEKVQAFLAAGVTDAGLKTRVEHLKDLGVAMSKTEEAIDLKQQTAQENAVRIEELKTQLATLKGVKTGHPLAASLEKKLAELTEANAKQTVELVGLQDRLMVAQVELQAAVADLSTERQNNVPSGRMATARP